MSFGLYNNINFYNKSINLTEIVPNIQNNKVLLVNSGNIGMPKIDQLDDGTLFLWNGGIPQLTNYHLFDKLLLQFLKNNKLNTTEQYKFIVFDMEEWSPIWNLTGETYHNMTISYVNKSCRGMNETQLLHRAKESWQQSSLYLMIRAIDYARKIYPNSLIGYYGYPGMPYWGETQSSRRYNDQMMALWQQVDVLLPSIYIPYVTNSIQTLYDNMRYVNRKTGESIRIRKKLVNAGFDSLPIVHYTWHKYHSGKPILEYPDVYIQYLIPRMNYVNGVNGIILWGNEGSADNDNESLSFFRRYKNFFVWLH